MVVLHYWNGLTIRIEADSPISDLELVARERIENNLRSLENKLELRIKRCISKREKIINIENKIEKRSEELLYTGRVLHLDGDKKYSDKSDKYYKMVGINAIVKNIPENKQPILIKGLLNKYSPDILVITGHDRNDKKWNRL